MSEASDPVKRPPRVNMVAVLLGAWVVGGGLAALSIGIKPGGFLSTSNVGELAALADIQLQLMPVDACNIEYAGRDKRGNRKHLDALFIETCSQGAYDHMVLGVPETWGRKGVGFEMTRSARDQRWRILVEKKEVPFEDLTAALTDFAPRIAKELPGVIEKQRRLMGDFDEKQQEHLREKEERAKKAPDSYPSR